ncbi:MAG TPA: polysaccharide deacetylase family protein [Gaiellaceae bacterium]
MGSRKTTGESARRGDLTVAPRVMYPAKAVLTRCRSLVWHARTREAQRGHGIRILFYHRVSDAADELAVSSRRFRAQMEWLARDRWEVLDVEAVASRLACGDDAGRVVGLSFDDAYADVGENAEPILARLGFRATVFVATGVTDGSARFAWYDEQPPVLTWHDIQRLDAAGTLSFEPHTITHPNLTSLGEEEARTEIVGSKRELERRLGRPAGVFCYPAGLAGERERRLVVDAGFAAAVSCEPGTNVAGGDPYFLRRIQVDHRDALVDFRAKVCGGHDEPLPLRRAWRRARYGARSISRA